MLKRGNWPKITLPWGSTRLKIKTLERTKDTLRIEIEGEGHSFCNLLQNTLLEDRGVEMAGYDMPHPLTLRSIVYIKVKKDSDPNKALDRALKKIVEGSDEFLSKFSQITGKA